jgi:histidinol-phosphatase
MQDSPVGTEDPDLALALRMADRADALTLAAFTGEAITFADKDDGSPVTETDLAVETALLEMVRHSRRGDGFLGEETGLTNDGPRLWMRTSDQPDNPRRTDGRRG